MTLASQHCDPALSSDYHFGNGNRRGAADWSQTLCQDALPTLFGDISSCNDNQPCDLGVKPLLELGPDSPRTPQEPSVFGLQQSDKLVCLIAMAISERVKSDYASRRCRRVHAGYFEASMQERSIMGTTPFRPMPLTLSDSVPVDPGGFQSRSASHETAMPQQGLSSTMLLVYKLPRCSNKQEVKAAFERFGVVTRTLVVRDADGVSKCFGFVHFREQEDAQLALQDCSLGRVILTDEDDKPWHVKADYAMDRSIKQSRNKKSQRMYHTL